MTSLDELYRQAADELVAGAPPIKESTRRRLIEIADRRRPEKLSQAA